jgi:hypothetical protein
MGRHAMANKVYPYYSIDPTDPDVYHDYSDCPAGQQIPDKNRRSGTGGRRRCLHCVRMD